MRCTPTTASSSAATRWRASSATQLPGTILTTSGGCAAHLAAVLGRDRVRELSQYLVDDRDGAADAAPRRRRRRAAADRPAGLLPPAQRARRRRPAARADRARRASTSSCPRPASAAARRGPTRSCARDDSRRVLDDKLDQIEAAEVDLVVAVNPGCLRQLQQGIKRRGPEGPRGAHRRAAGRLSGACAAGHRRIRRSSRAVVAMSRMPPPATLCTAPQRPVPGRADGSLAKPGGPPTPGMLSATG